MTTLFSYVTKFTLNKAHFAESGREYIAYNYLFSAYFKALYLLLFSILLVQFTKLNIYLTRFLFSLGLLEATNFYYQNFWWLAQQILNRVAKNSARLIISNRCLSAQTITFTASEV